MDRTVLGQRAVRSTLIVIGRIGSKDPAQVRGTHNDDMVEAVAPDRPDHPFGVGVLPGRPRGDRVVADAHRALPLLGRSAVDQVAIADETVWSTVLCKCLKALLHAAYVHRIESAWSFTIREGSARRRPRSLCLATFHSGANVLSGPQAGLDFGAELPSNATMNR